MKLLAKKIEKLLNDDKASIISVKVFHDVVIVRVDLWSRSQIERFEKVGKEIGMLVNSEIEHRDDQIVLSAVIGGIK